MKILFLILFIGSLSTQAYTQNEYIEYYNLVNQANRHWYEKNYAQALKQYQEAFSKVEYVHSINFAKAARSAAALKDYRLTKSYVLEALKRAYPSSFIDGKLFK